MPIREATGPLRWWLNPHPLVRAAWVAAGLALAEPRAARAENSLAYKYQEYRERDGRVTVRTQTAHVEAEAGVQWHLKVDGVIDAIAGAERGRRRIHGRAKRGA